VQKRLHNRDKCSNKEQEAYASWGDYFH
jgi:hypothetical protein